MNIPLFSTCWMMMIKSWRILDTVSFACITSYFVKQLSNAQTTRTNNAHKQRTSTKIYTSYILLYKLFSQGQQAYCTIDIAAGLPSLQTLKKNTNSLYYLYTVYIYIYIGISPIFSPYHGYHLVSLGITGSSFALSAASLRTELGSPPFTADLQRGLGMPRRVRRVRVECWELGAPHQGRWQRLTLSVSDAHSDHSGHGRSVWKNHEKP